MLASSPMNNLDKNALARALKNPDGPAAMVGEVAPHRGLEENWFIVVSPNRLMAYAVPVPTKVTDDPDAPRVAPMVSATAIRKKLTEQGITGGVLNGALEAFADRSELTEMLQVLQSEAAVEGRDARI